MSGTAFGTIVLHLMPEVGRSAGRSALVRTGDRIKLGVSARSISLLVGDAELSSARPPG